MGANEIESRKEKPSVEADRDSAVPEDEDLERSPARQADPGASSDGPTHKRPDAPRPNRDAPASDGGTVIVGGGAAGLAAAAFSRDAIVFERLPSPGRKILATGGGRCNFTHEGSADDLSAAFPGFERFVRPALAAFPPAAQRAWFASLGVPSAVEPGGFVFPASGRAGDVRAALLRAAAAAGARIECGARVERIVLAEDGASVRGVAVAGRGFVPAARVVLAAGGCARPALGTDGDSLRLARDAGLPVAPPAPALGALRADEPAFLRGLAGLTLPDARLRASGAEARGGLLLTGAGLSGPAALDLSARIDPPADVLAAWRADRPREEDWLAVFDAWRAAHGAALVRNRLAGELPRALAAALCVAAGVAEDATASRLRRDEARALARLCAACPVRVRAAEGWDACMATRGGVSARALSPRTLEARGVRGLFVAGEAAEPVGRCGGYNLAWAWASGRMAAFAPASGRARATRP